MSSLFGSVRSPTDAPSNPADYAARLERIKASVRDSLALQNYQELMTKVGEKCYAKCITKPGTSLSSSDEKCLSQCMDRYLEAFDMINVAFTTRLRKERLDLLQSQTSLEK